MNLADFLLKSVEKFPDMEALVFDGRRFTLKQLNERVNKLANALTKFGISKGEHIGLFSTNSHQCVEVLNAVAKAGGVLVPFNYRLKHDEAKGLFEHSEITTIFLEARYAEMITSLASELPMLNRFICFEKNVVGEYCDKPFQHYEALLSGQSADEPAIESGGEDIAVILYTSGTVGFPKGVMLSHSHIVFRIRTRDKDIFKLPEGGVSLMVLPNYHTGGIQGILKNLNRPMKLVIMRQFETVGFLETVQKEKVEVCTLVPTMIKRLIDFPDLDKYDISSLRQLRYGTAPMSPALLMEAMKKLPGCSFTQGYGMTEGSATTLSVEDHDLNVPRDEYEQKVKRLRSVGKAIEGVDIKIVDKNHDELPSGEVGKILIKGPAILAGYWKDPKATAEAVKDGWLETGDLGCLDEEGYLFIAGREKDIIIRGGENIAPVEIEAVLESHPKILEAAVIGVPDPEWGEVVKAIVVPRAGAEVSGDEVIEFCNKRLASYKRPASVVSVDSLPKNPIGKILKRVLREQYSEGMP